MNKYLLLFSSLFLFCSFPALTMAQDIPDSHEIIQKLSASPMNRELSISRLFVKLPNAWEYQFQNNQNTLTFRVPFHPGVIGKIEVLTDNPNLESSVQSIAQELHTEFQI